jgi:hypothetical protein
MTPSWTIRCLANVAAGCAAIGAAAGLVAGLAIIVVPMCTIMLWHAVTIVFFNHRARPSSRSSPPAV